MTGGKRVCLNCGQAPARIKWCSTGCRREARLDRETIRVQAERARPRACADCGLAFILTTRRGYPTQRCPRCRSEHRKVTQREIAKRRKTRSKQVEHHERPSSPQDETAEQSQGRIVRLEHCRDEEGRGCGEKKAG